MERIRKEQKRILGLSRVEQNSIEQNRQNRIEYHRSEKNNEYKREIKIEQQNTAEIN